MLELVTFLKNLVFSSCMPGEYIIRFVDIRINLFINSALYSLSLMYRDHP